MRRFQETCRKEGHQFQAMDVLQTNIVLHARKPLLRHRGHPIHANDIDVVLPRIGTSVTEVGCAVVNQFEVMGVPVVNDSQAIRRARDKLRSIQLLTRCNVDIPRTAVIRNISDLDQALDLIGGVPCVLKLLQGTQGIGVMLAESREGLESILQAFWSLGHIVLLQEFIAESKGRDVRAFVVGDKVVTAMRREAKLGEFRSNIHRGGLGRPVNLSQEDQEAVVEAAHAMGLQLAGVDFLESHSGPKIIEVNASPGFQGLEQATGADIAGEVVRFAAEYAKERRA